MSNDIHIDDLDKKILSMVSKNARIPFLEVARECGVSGAAVHQRVQRLTKMGIVTGSEFILSPSKMGYSTCAYMGIFLEKASLYNKVAKELNNIPEIVECHYITGEYSIFIKIYAKNNEHLKSVITSELQTIDGIFRTETFISLEETFKRQIPLG